MDRLGYHDMQDQLPYQGGISYNDFIQSIRTIY